MEKQACIRGKIYRQKVQHDQYKGKTENTNADDPKQLRCAPVSLFSCPERKIKGRQKENDAGGCKQKFTEAFLLRRKSESRAQNEENCPNTINDRFFHRKITFLTGYYFSLFYLTTGAIARGKVAPEKKLDSCRKC